MINSQDSANAKVLWFLGPTSSGKTTLAGALTKLFQNSNNAALHFDGDEVRNLFGSEHGFSDKDRFKVVKTLVYLAQKTTKEGIVAVVSALTANIDARKYIEAQLPNLIVIYVKCSLHECVDRDPKGLYAKAMKGDIDTLIGYNTKYLPPEHPQIIVDTEKYDKEKCLKHIVTELTSKFNMNIRYPS